MMDPWKLTQSNFDPSELGKYESLFTLGNGNLGLRGNIEEVDLNYNMGTYINGLYETIPIEYGESAYGYAKMNQAIINLVDGKIFRIYADGELFTLENATNHIRVLDIKKGVLTRSFSWLTKSGANIDIKIRRIVSLTKDSTAIQVLEFNIENKKVDLEIDSVFSDVPIEKKDSKTDNIEDPRIRLDSDKNVLNRINVSAEGTRVTMCHQTAGSRIALFSGMDHSLSGDYTPIISNLITKSEASVSMKFESMEGSFQLVKYLCYEHDQNASDRELEFNLLEDLDSCIRNGPDFYFHAQRKFLSDFWDRSDVVIKGDPELQFGLRFNMFHLLQSTGKTGKVSIAAKGLTGMGYEGHYFWDTEIYVLPYYIYTFPSIAKSLLSYRYSIIDKARARAAELSHKGVLFPWRTINGDEASAYFPAGTAQYHINADIAFGLHKYIKASGDNDFLFECGLEILIETARFWFDLGEYIPGFDGAFCIHEVTGPDEYTALINNNLYTNMMARENLLNASEYLYNLRSSNNEFYESFIKKFSISEEEIGNWVKAAELVRIPYDNKLSLHAQDDAFLTRPVWDFEGTSADKYPLLLHFHPLTIYRYQVIKQADVVMALFLQGQYFSMAEKKRNFDYYEELTTGDSSLSACIQGIVGKEIGYLNLSDHYLRHTTFIDLHDLNGNVRDGVHTASMAGSWMSIIYGIAGMRDSGETLSFSPRLSDKLEEISFKINYSGCLLFVLISKDKVMYKLLDGEKLSFNNYYNKIDLIYGESTTISLIPKLRAVLFDITIDDKINNLINELELQSVKYINLKEKEDLELIRDEDHFFESAESLKVRRWDCLYIGSESLPENDLKSAEIAYEKIENVKDITVEGLQKIHGSFYINWNRGIEY